MQVPPALRAWFVVHFVVDTLVGVPLLLAPEALLGHLGWTAVDPASPRLVGAALLGIGIQSLRGRNDGFEAFRAMLGLKVVWASAAILALAIAIARGAPSAAYAALSIFLAFLGVWLHYAIRLRQLARLAARPDDDDHDDDAAGGAQDTETAATD